MNDEGWWFQAVEGFLWRTDGRTDISDCRVAFATEKVTWLTQWNEGTNIWMVMRFKSSLYGREQYQYFNYSLSITVHSLSNKSRIQVVGVINTFALSTLKYDKTQDQYLLMLTIEQFKWNRVWTFMQQHNGQHSVLEKYEIICGNKMQIVAFFLETWWTWIIIILTFDRWRSR